MLRKADKRKWEEVPFGSMLVIEPDVNIRGVPIL